MPDLFKTTTSGQFQAALAMLRNCIAACPAEHWNMPIAKYPFWMVAYHTLCFADVYLAPDDASWQPQTGPTGLHPRGRAELDDEYPSRSFSQAELLGYADQCLVMLRNALAAETAETLAGPTGFPRRRFSRAELYLYNMRHIQHHAGQLSAALRRVGVETPWVSSGAP